MSRLPDLEGLAIFAKVAETRSFAAAAAELKLSKATVSKAVSRVERKLKTRLFNRTSRRIALTDAGRQLAGRAAHILAEGEAVEDAALAQATVPRGLVRLAAPMSFGLLHVAPLLPEFLATFSEVSVDLHLSDAMMPALIAGTGLGILPEFILRDALVAGRLERLLPDWSLQSGAVYWVTPPGGPRPKRVEVLADFLVEKLAAHTKRGTRAALGSILRPPRKANTS